MAIIKFENGTEVNFDGNPTQQDVEEVAQKLNLGGAKTSPQSSGGGFIQGLSNFVGTTGLGRGIASALSPDQTPDINRISQSSQKFLELAKQLPLGDVHRDRLLQLAKQTSGEAQMLGQQNIESIPTSKEVIGSAAQTGLSLATLGGLGTGGGLGAKVLKGSALGAGFGAAGALEADRIPTTGELATGAAIGGGIPLAGAGIGQLKSFIKNTLPKGIIKAYLPGNKDLTQHIVENTKLGTTKQMLSNAKNNVKNLSGQIDDILKTTTEKSITTKNLFTSAAQSFGQTGGGGTITGNEVKKITARVAPEVRGLLSKDTLSLRDANRLRMAIDRALGDRFFTVKHSPFSKEVAGTFNSFLRDLVQSSAPKTQPIFSELSKEITIRNGLNQAVTKMGRITLTDLIAAIGGLGSIAGQGILRGAATTAALIGGERALRSPAVGIGAA